MDLSIAGPEAGKHHNQNFGNLSYPHETAMTRAVFMSVIYKKKLPCPATPR